MPGPAIHVRPLQQFDIPSVLTIQADSPEISPWTAGDYERVARSEMAGWVAVEGAAVAGFLVARRIVADTEILNFAVGPAFRRQGVGEALVRKSLDWAKSFRAERALLEVRISNLAAIRFYEKHGFEVVGRRQRYYTAPIEDALLLTAALPGAEPMQ